VKLASVDSVDGNSRRVADPLHLREQHGNHLVASSAPGSMEWRRKSRRREDAVHQRRQGRYPP
jgi:hypothetical protein